MVCMRFICCNGQKVTWIDFLEQQTYICNMVYFSNGSRIPAFVSSLFPLLYCTGRIHALHATRKRSNDNWGTIETESSGWDVNTAAGNLLNLNYRSCTDQSSSRLFILDISASQPLCLWEYRGRVPFGAGCESTLDQRYAYTVNRRLVSREASILSAGEIIEDAKTQSYVNRPEFWAA